MVAFLLDTNVISEAVKPRPDPNVIGSLTEGDEDRMYLSVATLAEIGRGVELMANGKRRDRLTAWLAIDVPLRFENRILDIDRGVAAAWATIMARGQRAGMTLGTMDAFFAATAEAHALTLVTRNIQHFAHVGIPLLDPWLWRQRTQET